MFLRKSTLWASFEEQERRQFVGAVILGDFAYPCNDWLTPLFTGDVEGSRLDFNIAHMKRRRIVERSNGVIKKRFYT